jgi:ATP-dependent helicase/nuclease subunit B
VSAVRSTSNTGFSRVPLTARLIVEDVEPVTLLAALKHPLACGGMSAAAFRQQVRALERACLRGPRISGGFSGVLAELRRARLPAPERDLLAAWVTELQLSAKPFADLVANQETDLATLIRAHVAFAENLARDALGKADALWSREAGEAAAALLSELLAFGP